MRKLPVFILSLLLVPAIASAQSAGPPPPPPDAQLPPPPAVPRSRAPNDDQVGRAEATTSVDLSSSPSHPSTVAVGV